MSPDADRPATYCPTPTRRALAPAEHAVALLEMLQGPGGRTGTITVDELKAIHREFCQERDYEFIRWTAVGRELRKLLGARKDYDRIDGERVRVYRIPPVARVRLASVA